MPELSDDMYCSQQIMVPPMFPYILRQYAKAAIRSQPTDLLRWSTAYFRCLSLNLPPPVKPRLEYPLPKDYDGVTPGWLKALLFQLANSTHVDFKVLWDRWIGACQNHATLIKILCLGGFTDAMNIPLLRFIGLCVGFLSENLTQTMIMFCEVVTEEPEGGSAMISVEAFIDVYTFLAGIDASKDQVLLNRYFPDEILVVLEKKKEASKEHVEEEQEKKEQVEKEGTIASESVEEETKVEEGLRVAISCPDLVDDQADVTSEDSDHLDHGSRSTIVDDQQRIALAQGIAPAQIEEEKKSEKGRRRPEKQGPAEFGEEEGEGFPEYCNVELMGELGRDSMSISMKPYDKVSTDSDSDKKSVQKSISSDQSRTHDQSQDTIEDSITGSVTKPTASSLSQMEDKPESSTASVNISLTQSERKPEEEEDVNKYLAPQSDVPESASDILDVPSEVVIKAPAEELGEYSVGEPEAAEEQELVVEGKFTIEEVFVEAHPGIGPVVPDELVQAVVGYMKGCAAEQHGMVMPRNIRHYSCPPLEVYQ